MQLRGVSCESCGGIGSAAKDLASGDWSWRCSQCAREWQDDRHEQELVQLVNQMFDFADPLYVAHQLHVYNSLLLLAAQCAAVYSRMCSMLLSTPECAPCCCLLPSVLLAAAQCTAIYCSLLLSAAVCCTLLLSTAHSCYLLPTAAAIT